MPDPDKLGRLPSPPDPRDHPLARYVPALAAVSAERPDVYAPYAINLPIYDQVGPSCVGNSQALGATIDQRRDLYRTLIYDGEDLYARAKAVDGIPNVDGTYPRVALKIRADEGILIKSSPRKPAEVGQLDQISAYAALHTIEEIVVAIWLYGSVELGSTWYAEWDEVDPETGVLPPGRVAVGGHDYRAVGYDLRGRYRPPALLWQQSWGPTYGNRIRGSAGRAWMPTSLVDFADFEAWRSIDLQGA